MGENKGTYIEIIFRKCDFSRTTKGVKEQIVGLGISVPVNRKPVLFAKHISFCLLDIERFNLGWPIKFDFLKRLLLKIYSVRLLIW